MIPYSLTWGGCQRMYYLASELEKAGHEVDIVALRSSGYDTFGKELLHNVTFVEGEKQPVGTEIPTGGASLYNKFLIRFIKKVDALLFNEITPGNGIQTFLRAKKAESHIKEKLSQKDYDAVIISGPPFALFRLNKLIKKRSKATLIMDYRDPWNLWKDGNAMCARREKKFQSLADVIVCTNRALCDDMSSKYSIDRSRYYVIANGFSQSLPLEDSNDTVELADGMNIVYTGSVVFTNSKDDYRNPMQLLKAFKQLIDERYRDIDLWFVGAGLSNKTYIDNLIIECSGHLHILGQVPESVAKTYLKKSDVCLLLHTAEDNSGRYLVSGKAYDYIQMKKYIFSVSRQDSQHAAILNEYNIGINVTNSYDAILKGMRDCYDKWKNSGFNHIYDNVNVDSFSRHNQIKNYIGLIESVC